MVLTRAGSLALGDFLFRHRSYLPLALVPAVVAGIALSECRWASPATDLLWELGAMSLALAGLALRIWVVGVAAHGTSGRNTRAQKAASLNTTGAYSIVRHPLYLANGLIALALATFVHSWAVPPLTAAAVLVYYTLIARREEAFLRDRFGAAFDAWARRTPAYNPFGWPRRWRRAAHAFDWRKALRQEFYAATLVLVAPAVLDVVEDLFEGAGAEVDPVWQLTAALGIGLWIVLRTIKKHTGWLRSPDTGA